jgi:hypothetical protein
VRIADKYIEVLVKYNNITLNEWVEKILETYPDLEDQIKKYTYYKKNGDVKRTLKHKIHKNTDIGELKRMGILNIDKSQNPSIYSMDVEKYNEYIEIGDTISEKGISDYDRSEIIEKTEETWLSKDRIHASTYAYIQKLLWIHIGMKFEIDHAKSLKEGGKHSPENFHLLLKEHNRSKNSKSTKRMSYEEQVRYIKAVVQAQNCYYEIYDEKEVIDNEAIEEIFKLLKTVY